MCAQWQLLTMTTLQLAIPASVAGKGATGVGMSPVAAATILDHNMRKGEGEFVLGILVGAQRDGEIAAKSAIGVPFTESEEEGLSVNLAYLQSMLELHVKAAPRDVVVGSYITAPEFSTVSAPLHRFLTTYAGATPTVLLTVDPESLQFQAYGTRQVGHGSAVPVADAAKTPMAPGVLFTPVPTQISVDDDLGPAVEVLQSETEYEIPLNSGLGQLHTILDDVKRLADQVIAYVGDVVGGAAPADPTIGAALADALKAYPLTGAAEAEFRAHLSDVAMVSYLASAVAAETDVSGKLNLAH